VVARRMARSNTRAVAREKPDGCPRLWSVIRVEVSPEGS
jgi:hypothetical protein